MPSILIKWGKHLGLQRGKLKYNRKNKWAQDSEHTGSSWALEHRLPGFQLLLPHDFHSLLCYCLAFFFFNEHFSQEYTKLPRVCFKVYFLSRVKQPIVTKKPKNGDNLVLFLTEVDWKVSYTMLTGPMLSNCQEKVSKWVLHALMALQHFVLEGYFLG